MRSHPSDEEVAPPVSRETVVYTRQLHRIVHDTACQAAAMTKKSILLLNTDHAYYHFRTAPGLCGSDDMIITCI